jgi:hypothetical protein
METNQKSYFLIGITLPLSWLSFTVEQPDGAALVKWQTASEKNTQSFIVQRSSDGITWTDLASIHALGEPNKTSRYSYSDKYPLAGVNSYRIKAVDADGRTGYSIIKTIRHLQKQELFAVISNASTRGYISMQVNKGANIALYNSDGKMLWIKKFSRGTQTISCGQIPKGIYWLVAEGSSQKVFIQ